MYHFNETIRTFFKVLNCVLRKKNISQNETVFVTMFQTKSGIFLRKVSEHQMIFSISLNALE